MSSKPRQRPGSGPAGPAPRAEEAIPSAPRTPERVASKRGAPRRSARSTTKRAGQTRTGGAQLATPRAASLPGPVAVDQKSFLAAMSKGEATLEAGSVLELTRPLCICLSFPLTWGQEQKDEYLCESPQPLERLV